MIMQPSQAAPLRRPRSGNSPAKSGKAKAIKRNSGITGHAPPGYFRFLNDLKERIRAARVKAVMSANRELVELYWHIGKGIVGRQRTEGWGRSVVERLSHDFRSEFPGNAGLSPQNIWHMRSFYAAWAGNIPFLPQPAGELDGHGIPLALLEIPWYHNVVLVEQVKGPAERLWYAQKALEQGWSRAMLEHQIECRLYERQGKAVTNFSRALPPSRSDMAGQALKDPYVFDFLAMADDKLERDLERGLTENVRKFLLELGVGFAFVGSQYHLEVEGEDFYIDLLFYHLALKCFVVIDLKTGQFRPEDAGKMGFYLAAVDDRLRRPGDNPSIGIVLCRRKKRLIAEYALRNILAPIGISEYRLTRDVPADLQESLPDVDEMERRLKAMSRTGHK